MKYEEPSMITIISTLIVNRKEDIKMLAGAALAVFGFWLFSWLLYFAFAPLS